MLNPDEQFLFVHPQKCAGNSLRTIFRNEFSNDFDRGINPLYEPNGSGHWRARQWKNYAKENNIDFDSLFKIAVVRNPWDRAVSYYHHLQVHRDYKRPFRLFILNDTRYISSIGYSVYSKFTIDNKFIINYTVKQETFQQDVEALMIKLNIKNYNIPHDNHKTNRKEYDYRKYYDDNDLIDQVYNVSQFEINKFNYIF
ncbi:sulfotransferase family protein [bacterium]|nr:sulfotransferase family protein [bacterium]